MEKEILTLLEQNKFNELYGYLKKLNSADIVALLEEISDEEVVFIFRLLPKDKAGEIFSYMSSDMQERLIQALTDRELKDVVSRLYMDDTVDLIGEMPSNVVKRIIKHTNPEHRKIINELLNYPDDSAGSMMTIEYIDLKEDMTVEDAFDRIRKTGTNKETIYTCYVLENSRKLIGLVSVRTLLLSDKDAKIKDIMETNIITVTTLDDKEDVAKAFDKYDFLALPVVDKENRLVGIITIDDAVDVMQDENTEDFEIMAAITPSEDTYFNMSVFMHAKNRIVWLLFLMLSSAITGTIITKYENAFAAVPLLVAFIPMLMDTGGNCGSQSSTLIIRGLAMDEIRTKDVLKVLFKEMRVALIVGVALAIVNGTRIIIQYHNIGMSIVVGITLIGTVCMSKILGCILPMLAKKLKLDPAIMAAPLITTIVDTCSVLMYFAIATKVLNF